MPQVKPGASKRNSAGYKSRIMYLLPSGLYRRYRNLTDSVPLKPRRCIKQSP